MQVSASKRNNGKLSVVCVLDCESESRIKYKATLAKKYASSKRRHLYLRSQTKKMPRATQRFRSDQNEEQPEAEDDSSESLTYVYVRG